MARLLGVSSLAAVNSLGVALNPAYLRGVGEQVAMVMGNADLPYVRVYHGTLPVLYSLRELAFWGLGPLLLAAVLIGSGAGVTKVLKRWRRWFAVRWTPGVTLLLVLLAWLIPMAVRLSTLQVKYLRYWEPLVVPGTMVAAWWLVRLRKRHRRLAVSAVVAGSIVWGLGFVWAFVDPHPHRTAAGWLSTMIETEQVVAYEHWDETLALHPKDGPVERIDLPSYDLPDDSEKSLRWCHQLARADWVVLTSNRVRRTSEVSPEKLTERVQRPLPYLEDLDFRALGNRFVDPLPSLQGVPSGIRQTLDLTIWAAVFGALCISTWALFLPTLRRMPDAGFGLALVTGLIIPAWVRDSDFLFLIQAVLSLSRTHSEQMTTMVDLTGRFPSTIKRTTPSDRHREPLGRLRADTGTKPPQGPENLRPSQAVFGNGLLHRSGGPRPGAMPLRARCPRILLITRCSRMTLTIRISPPQLAHTIGSTS